MRRAALSVLLASSLLAAFAFSVFQGGPPGTPQAHWAAAPLLAFSIVLSMGGLVALAAGAPR